MRVNRTHTFFVFIAIVIQFCPSVSHAAAPNTAVIDTVWFNSTSNAIGVRWTFDLSSATGTYGVSWGLHGVYERGAAAPSQPIPLSGDTMTTWIDLSEAVIFDTAYVVGVWFRGTDNQWSEPTDSSEATVRTGPFTWQKTRYFPAGIDTVTAFNGCVVLWNDGDWQGDITIDTVTVHTPSAEDLEGFVTAGVGFSLPEGGRSSLPPVNVGIRYDEDGDLPDPSRFRIYRWDDEAGWSVEAAVEHDPLSRLVWTTVQDLSAPFMLLADTQRVGVEVLSDTAAPVAANHPVTDSIIIADNIVNTDVRFLVARAGEVFGKDSVRFRTDSRSVRRQFLIPASYVTDDAGVRVLVVLSDGTSSVNARSSKTLTGALREYMRKVRKVTAAFDPDPLLAGELRFDIKNRIDYYVVYTLTAHLLKPRLERLLKQATATAWICANDMTALICLDFLKKVKVRVPQKISVMGFDDTHAAAAARLTSYNFNPAGLARALIGQIIRPDAGLSAPREVEGFINVRDTTAPPA